MRRQHEGYVLLIVLVYMQLMMLLSIANIKQLSLLKKQVRLQQQQSAMRDEARYSVKELTPDNQACFRHNLSVRFLRIQSLSWWKSNGCIGYALQHAYYYFFTDLGADECAVIDNGNHQFSMAHYYRISLLLDANTSILMQKTLVEPDRLPPHCTHSAHIVNASAGAIRWL